MRGDPCTLPGRCRRATPPPPLPRATARSHHRRRCSVFSHVLRGRATVRLPPSYATAWAPAARLYHWRSSAVQPYLLSPALRARASGRTTARFRHRSASSTLPREAAPSQGRPVGHTASLLQPPLPCRVTNLRAPTSFNGK